MKNMKTKHFAAQIKQLPSEGWVAVISRIADNEEIDDLVFTERRAAERWSMGRIVGLENAHNAQGVRNE